MRRLLNDMGREAHQCQRWRHCPGLSDRRIGLPHPVTLLHEMARRDAKRGLASLRIGGGMGVALAIER
jgi:hypothetical protein